MTAERTLPRPPAGPELEPPRLDPAGERPWAAVTDRFRLATGTHLAFASVLGLAAVVYLWNLTISGYANTYYAMAAQAASRDWGAFFFGSLDAGNFITLDKPPAAVWLMGLSVRMFGLSSWSILLPQALLGIASVGVLFLAVRRPFGPAAAAIAGIVMALTPAATLIFRYDNPDALLTFVLVTAAWALGRGLENGRLRWAILAASLVGLAFLTKYLQACLVLPAFAVTWLVAAPGSLRRRLGGLAAAAATVALTSGWWVAIVESIPVALRPHIGGSTNNSVLDLVLGYDGLGRIFGQGIGGGTTLPGGDGGGAGPGAGFGGTPGLVRMFNTQFGGEISWLIPLALLAFVAGLVIHRRVARTDRRRAAYLLWGGWLVVHVAVFSFMSGIAHPYYSVMLAPAIGALVGAGVVDLWRRRARSQLAGPLLAVGLVGSAAWGLVVLGRIPSFMPGLGIAAVALAIAAGLVLLLPAAAVDRRIQRLALGLGIVAILAGPAAYSAATTSRALAGGDPSAGPAEARVGGFAGGPGGAGPGGLGVSSAGSSTLVEYLLANQGDATWIVAAQGSGTAAEIQLAAGQPVLTMGGFSGSDAAPTVDGLRALVADGKLRFVLLGGPGAGPRGASGDGVASWVAGACTAVDAAFAGGASLYDCAAAG